MPMGLTPTSTPALIGRKIDRATRSSYQPVENTDDAALNDVGKCLMVRASYKDNGPEKANIVITSPDPFDESGSTPTRFRKTW